MLKEAPIGVFDSGLGGLTIAKSIIEKLPYENIIYIGDEAHVPYGDKSPDVIRDFALGIIDFFVNKGAKLVVMACNMSSAYALSIAREIHPNVPIIGTIEAGARKAVEVTNGNIGVLATNGTAAARAYTEAIRAISSKVKVIEQGCPKLVPLVENDRCECIDAYEAIGEYVAPMLNANVDTIVLGCTHYPFLINAIRLVVGTDVQIVDPAEYTANEVVRVIGEYGLFNSPENDPVRDFYTTADPERFARLGGRFLNSNMTAKHIRWGIDLRENIWSEKITERMTSSAR